MGWLPVFLLFSSVLPLALAAPGAGEGYLQARSSVPKPGVGLVPVKTAIAVAPTTTGLPGLHPETTAIAVIPKPRGTTNSSDPADTNNADKTKEEKKKKKKPKRENHKGKIKTVTIVHSIPVTATIVKRSDTEYPSPVDDEPSGNPMEIDTEDYTTVSILQVAVPTDRPVIITTYECPTPTDTPSSFDKNNINNYTPELAKQLIKLKTKAKVSCLSITTGLQADLASQTTDDESGVAHVVREGNGATQRMSVTWVLTETKPSKKECVMGMKMIWDQCANLGDESIEGFSGGKALLKSGVFFNLEAVTAARDGKVQKGKGRQSG
ncbi:hypothetical protein TWF569_006050 [Orbilia oligospora]|uniref:Uncharacterized protein n=1 Tax=Orbilia oligospora TaxID=2813651 RepID=A0A7C8J0J3_ORBOL|nr:hypothetical protein TWF102_002111 [Orbilia oligospora]KAF3087996.1 hypothetical protein TWF706_010980 [Orbilia oligospora]KAF3147558.1 hypothetical protein TWF569_006050 [Orbilia oligospora]